jgi:hypothetical protein
LLRAHLPSCGTHCCHPKGALPMKAKNTHPGRKPETKPKTTSKTSKYSEEEKRQLREPEKWDNRLENVQHCVFKRKRRAAKAETDAGKLAAMWEHLASQHKSWFHAYFEESVTELAPLVEKCLDDVQPALAKRGGWGPLAVQIEFLLKGVRGAGAEPEALEAT